MNKVLLLAIVMVAGRVAAAETDGVAVFRAGLVAYQANGPDALLGAWYDAEEQAMIGDLRQRLIAATRGLGEVVDTEVFAPTSVGRHLQHLYGVIYFRKRPLWLRADYYAIEGRSGFISLEFSRSSEDILPLGFGPTVH
jgi:hypothetical protein